jgi:predicted restriction endonuclease
MVSKVFNENNSNYGLKQFEGKEISLPSYEKYFPLMDNFIWHRERIYKG